MPEYIYWTVSSAGLARPVRNVPQVLVCGKIQSFLKTLY